MNIKADFHIHSCLSPCASLDMSPRDIVEIALSKGINLIALSDHNSALNDNIEDAMNISDYIYDNLIYVKYNPEKFGDQAYVDKDNNIVGFLDKYLGVSTNLSIDKLLAIVHDNNGLFIPAHIDREFLSMISQLGFLPDNDYDAIELSKSYIKSGNDKDGFIRKFKNKYPIISDSDAHYPEDIGKAYNMFEIDIDNIKSFDIKRLREVLKNQETAKWKIKVNY